ncbi:MAG: substrate-binding domain-containing protein [Phycisphaerae bacterium]|nr:substrate-binding domain-containing protein [Phycisphaerae bacterium]
MKNILMNRIVVVALALTAATVWGEDPQPKKEPHKLPPELKVLRLGLIAKSQSNPVFQAARVGAVDAAKEWSEKLGIPVEVDWRTPLDEDAQKQAEYLEQLALQGVRGIAISCSDANTVTDAINRAVARGIPVVCFDSDARNSKRFCFHGVDDLECGRRLMAETAKALGPAGGDVAILAGNQNAPNLQKRVAGAKEEAAKHKNIRIVDVYYHKETPQDGAARVEQVQQANPHIKAWCMVGGWPLFTDVLLKWEPGRIKIVAVDALPSQLPYVEKGVAQVLMAQHCYNWGHRSIDLLVERIAYGREPKNPIDTAPLIPVTAENAKEFGKNWEKWLRKL